MKKSFYIAFVSGCKIINIVPLLFIGTMDALSSANANECRWMGTPSKNDLQNPLLMIIYPARMSRFGAYARRTAGSPELGGS